MAKCDCGADSSRLVTKGFETGKLHTICPSCEPGHFAEAFRDPSDNKIYLGPEVYPTLYKRDAEGKYHAKDELVADTIALMQSDPDAEKKKAWRAMREKTRRITPMTADEIRRAKTGPVAKVLEEALDERRKEAMWERAIDTAAREAAVSGERTQ